MRPRATSTATTCDITDPPPGHVLAPRVTVLVGDGLITVTVTGPIDQLTALEFSQDVLELWPVCVGVLAIDLSACTYFSDDAARTLQELSRRQGSNRAELRVTATHPDVIAVLISAKILVLPEGVPDADMGWFRAEGQRGARFQDL